MEKKKRTAEGNKSGNYEEAFKDYQIKEENDCSDKVKPLVKKINK